MIYLTVYFFLYYNSLELKRAIDEIRNDFRELNEIEKRELEAWYKVKSEEIKVLAEKHVSKELLPNILSTNRGLKETVKYYIFSFYFLMDFFYRLISIIKN